MNYTIKDLRNEIARLNRGLFLSNKTCFIREQGRNGYQAADLYSVDSEGFTRCMSMIGGGTSREVSLYCYQESTGSYIVKTMTRQKVKTLLAVNGVDFSKDFHELDNAIVELIAHGAKLSRYRKPQNANGSTARYFFNHLVKRVKL